MFMDRLSVGRGFLFSDLIFYPSGVSVHFFWPRPAFIFYATLSRED